MYVATVRTIFLSALLTTAAAAQGGVSFVGCPSDGQAGPQPIPDGFGKRLNITTETAAALAYYKGPDGPGVLAPRGWHCFEIYGSNGSTLFVTPQALDAKMLLSDKPQAFATPIVKLSVAIGDTSGRFDVARTIMRVFPAYQPFARKVIAEKLEPAKNFPSGPYPSDKLVRKSPTVVEFATPAMTQGLGNSAYVAPSGDPIRGVAILTGSTPDALKLTIRLPASQRALADIILQQLETEAQ